MAPTKISSPNRSEAARLLVSGFRFLRFPEPLESEFRAEHRARLRGWNRMAIIVAACTVTGYAILDFFVLSREHSHVANMVRFGMHVPAVLLMLVLHVPSASTTAGTTSASASSRRCSASARSSWRRLAGERGAAHRRAAAAGIVLLLFHGRACGCARRCAPT